MLLATSVIGILSQACVHFPVVQKAARVPSPTDGASAPTIEHEWTVDELVGDLDELSGRDFKQGQALFNQALCGRCHAFSSYSEGSGFAPDLSSVGTQFNREFVLRSILDPSETMNGQHYYTVFQLKNGETVTGRLIEADDGKFVVAPSIMTPNVTVEIAEADVVKREPSPVSPMPSGLMNTFTRDQILDLIAFLVSSGNPSAAIFRK